MMFFKYTGVVLQLALALAVTGCELPMGNSTSAQFNKSAVTSSATTSSASTPSSPNSPANPAPVHSSPSSAPVINSFVASSNSLTQAGSVTLSWSVSNAAEVSIDQGVGSVSIQGTKSISVSATKTYTLTATSSTGASVNQPLTIIVGAVTRPAISYFEASLNPIYSGEATTLSWSTTGATTISISPAVGAAFSPIGNITVNPSVTTTYTLNATDAAGLSASKSVVVTVNPGQVPAPVINSFAASLTSVPYGAGTVLSWTAINETSLSLSGVGAVATSIKTIEVYPTSTTTYILTATNRAGVSVNQSVTVTMAPPIINSFTASLDPLSSERYSFYDLNWTSTGGSSASLSASAAILAGGSTGQTNSVNQLGASSSWNASPLPGTSVTVTLTVNNVNASASVSKTITITVPESNCTFNGQTVTSGQSINVYTAQTVPYGTACSSVQKSILCTNGAFPAGTYYPTCVVGPQPTPTPTEAVISSFTASPTTIDAGNSSLLRWNTTGASSVVISGGLGNESASGNVWVNPTATTTYTLTATNIGGVSVTQSVTVTVNPVPAPVINSFTASSTTITAGGGSVLSWNTSGASTLSIDQGLGIQYGAISGTPVTPSSTTTYTLTATNTAGISVTSTVTIVVNPYVKQVVFLTQPSPFNTAGSNLASFSVSAIDQNNNSTLLPTGSTCSAVVVMNSNSGLIGGTYSNVPVTNGVAVFSNVSFEKAGIYSLKVSCTGVTTSSSESSQFFVTAATPTNFAIASLTQSPLNTSCYDFVLTLTDIYGNPITDASVTASSSTPAMSLTGGQLTELDNGKVEFPLVCLSSVTGGSFQVTFNTDGLAVSSAPILVTGTNQSPSPSSNLTVQFVNLPTKIFAGNLVSFYLQVVDPNGNVVIPQSADLFNCTIGLSGSTRTSSTQKAGVFSFINAYSALSPGDTWQLTASCFIQNQETNQITSPPIQILAQSSITGILSSPEGRVSGVISLSTSLTAGANNVTTLDYYLAPYSITVGGGYNGTGGSFVATTPPSLLGSSLAGDTSFTYLFDTTTQPDGYYVLTASPTGYNYTDVTSQLFFNPYLGDPVILIDNKPQFTSDMVGGSGGNSYTDMAPSGSYMYGFNSRSYEVLDTFQPIWIGSASQTGVLTSTGNSHGGAGVFYNSITCKDPSYVVTGLTVGVCNGDGNQIGSISLDCQNFGWEQTDSSQISYHNPVGGCTYQQFQQLTCPQHQAVIGIRGRSDSENEAIQIICK